MPGRITMPNVVGEAIPRLARARTGIMRVGTVTGTPANYSADVTFDGASVPCNYMAGWVPVAGQRVVVIAHTDLWLIVGPAPGDTADLMVGDAASTNSRKLHQGMKSGVDAYEAVTEIFPPDYGWLLRFYKNGVEQGNAAWQQGQFWSKWPTSGPPRYVPFATEIGHATVTTTASASGVLSNQPLTTGKFTQTPIIFTQSSNSSIHSWPGNISTTKFDIGIRHLDNTAGNYSILVWYIALQLSYGAAEG